MVAHGILVKADDADSVKLPNQIQILYNTLSYSPSEPENK